jgi:hypothetical protein
MQGMDMLLVIVTPLAEEILHAIVTAIVTVTIR